MRIGSLFSGIGGLELGLEWSGLGETVWQVEIDPKLRNCLATHWPNARRYSDITTIRGTDLAPVDLICGGFPCQDVSSAGKRAGLSGARSGLWSEFRRIVEERQPRWVCVENVASGATKWVDAIRSDLERIGYESLSIPIGAADCGAWHERQRVFIAAYRNGVRELQPERLKPQKRRRISNGVKESSPNSHGELLREQSGRRVGEGRTDSTEPDASSQAVSNTSSERPSEPNLERTSKRTANVERHSGWADEPDVARMVHGFPGRVDRQRSLGNSVVPQCAEVVGYVIQILDELIEARHE